MTKLPTFLLAALLPVLTGCGGEAPPRLGDAGPRPAKISSRSALEPGAKGAVLMATGRQSFEGTLPVRCAVHGKTGLQVNLRTGDSDLPVVTVRIGEIQGEGPYRGQLFVTGRNRTGALAGSTGEVSLDLREDGTNLQGSFEGTYQGEAGKGSVQGRFRGCSYPLGNAAPAGVVSSLAAR
ncbi:MAG TPA: hypothetical protein VH394_06525 [Thermoanaerobaculia bacterium]|jgi:hypothetical protein|nr:hypothetical protein [Thermoanaerobaculia bacterium]